MGLPATNKGFHTYATCAWLSAHGCRAGLAWTHARRRSGRAWWFKRALLQGAPVLTPAWLLGESRFRGCRAGLARPRVEVRWEDLAVEARVLVGQRARPTVLSFYRDALMARSPWLHILAPASTRLATWCVTHR